ncbi:MAG: hypothetical protein QUV02_09660 [Maricaulis sp.]|jgi:hypothetical protein|nr:hypothetical protein [Maricaulis sp.]MDM7984708.1 hypothetical protein [Maricaulis sp.]
MQFKSWFSRLNKFSAAVFWAAAIFVILVSFIALLVSQYWKEYTLHDDI